MKILLNNIGKKYNKQWIFKELSFCFDSGNSYAITGGNGSGKSTLIQSILGSIQLSTGSIEYQINNTTLEADRGYQHFSFASPYVELIEEMTLLEMLTFHQKFKPFYTTISQEAIIDIVGLQNAQQKQIVNFSSGMKQRLKLALAFFSNTKALLLDEPTSNLDAAGITMYQNLIENYTTSRTLLISSNDSNEYHMCNHILNIHDYK
jgi:ABC-type multidrug transport system ATPase subunit